MTTTVRKDSGHVNLARCGRVPGGDNPALAELDLLASAAHAAGPWTPAGLWGLKVPADALADALLAGHVRFARHSDDGLERLYAITPAGRERYEELVAAGKAKPPVRR